MPSPNLKTEPWEIDELVRDICSVDYPKVKSDFRQRITQLLSKQRLDIIELCEGKKKDTGPIPTAQELASHRPPADPIEILKVGYNTAINDIVTTLKDKIKE